MIIDSPLIVDNRRINEYHPLTIIYASVPYGTVADFARSQLTNGRT